MKFTTFGRQATVRTALLAGAAALALPAAAQAQDAADDTDEDTVAAPADGNVIIVTATKREQTLQETPVAVSVTSAETIEQAQIRDVADLATLVPSLRVSTNQSAFATSYSIRGFGTDGNNIGLEPSVAMFVDGVYRSRAVSQISDLPDIQRVEVLRGPQSTLFGKNASAGVISIVTKEPEFEFGGMVEASYGNYDAMVVKGFVTGPITDSIAFSAGAGINKRDGFLTNGFNGDDINDAAQITYDILRVVEQIPVTIEIYDLSGRAVRRWTNDRAVGSFSEAWDGTDDEDNLVPPGLYLMKLTGNTDEGDFASTRVVSVVY